VSGIAIDNLPLLGMRSRQTQQFMAAGSLTGQLQSFAQEKQQQVAAWTMLLQRMPFCLLPAAQEASRQVSVQQRQQQGVAVRLLPLVKPG
jgi:hypothetical protein